MGDMVSSDIRYTNFKREGTDDDIKEYRERIDDGDDGDDDDDDVKMHFEKSVDVRTIRNEFQGGCPSTPDGEEVGSRRREDVPTKLNNSRGSIAGLDELREDSKAVKALRAAKFAKSARSSYRARLKWGEDQRMESETDDSFETRDDSSSPEEGKIQISEFVPVLDQETIRRIRGRVDRATPTGRRR